MFETFSNQELVLLFFLWAKIRESFWCLHLFCSCLSRCSEHSSNAQTQLHSWNPDEWPEVEEDPDLRQQKKRKDFSQVAVRDLAWNKLLWFHPSTLLLPTNSQRCPQQQVVSELAESATSSAWLAARSAVGWTPQVRNEVHWWNCWRKDSVMELHCFKPNKTITTEETLFSADFQLSPLSCS